MILLDGNRLAARRASVLAERATEVRHRRGRPPRLLILAFGDEDGNAPHVDRKLRACAAVGVEAVPLILPQTAGTAVAVRVVRDAARDETLDGLFVQFPFPATIDGDALAAAIPVHLDVDVMTPKRIAQFMEHTDALPPVTVSAALLLLEAYGVSIAARSGIVVGADAPFSRMFGIALERHGAVMTPLVSPGDPELRQRVAEAEVAVVAAARPALLEAGDLAAGSVAVDAGYFNEGARGDIDTSRGTDHLGALAPVPGGIGPMTVSALIDRVILFAERR